MVRVPRCLVTLGYTENLILCLLYFNPSVRENFSFQSQSEVSDFSLCVSSRMSHVSCYQALQSFLFNNKTHEIVLGRCPWSPSVIDQRQFHSLSASEMPFGGFLPFFNSRFWVWIGTIFSSQGCLLQALRHQNCLKIGDMYFSLYFK